MPNFLSNLGEEWLVENNANGSTVTIGLYNDSTDNLDDTSDLSNISTEPTGSNYAAQTSTITTKQISGDFGFDNDSQISFDTSDSSVTVDHAYIQVNFTSDTVAGDSSGTDHLIAVGSLSQSRDLSQIDTLNINAGDLEVTLD